ncbi:MAG: hypothetical protein BGO51_24920 [Rhodospirillales bacterium 69-11]|nr:hypothetical protein [Rhodospirillales bacterium]OJW28137.1 MAG: hypothetical protein BGO51_24920 [Rhodospirillales bacterium 69-11]
MNAPFARRILAPALFAEDFDLPPARRAEAPTTSGVSASEPPYPFTPPQARHPLDPPEAGQPFDPTERLHAPEPVEPPQLFTADDLAAARADGFAAGEDAGRRAAEADAAAAAQAALAAIARHLADAAAAAHAVADAAAEGVAQTVLAGLAAAFPRFSARFGPAEVESLVQRILPAVRTEPRVAIQLAPAALDGVQAVLADLDPECRERIRLTADERIAPGDVRIAWETGEATRDGARLWQEIEAILAPAGLLPAVPASPAPSRPGASQPEAFRPETPRPDAPGLPRVKEPAHGY